MDLRSQINQLEQQLKNIEKQISELRKTCDHKDTRTTFRKSNSGGLNIVVVCDKCFQMLRLATNDEQQQFLKS